MKFHNSSKAFLHGWDIRAILAGYKHGGIYLYLGVLTTQISVLGCQVVVTTAVEAAPYS